MNTQITDLRQRLESLAPIHFLGMGGSGMAPLASLVATAGVELSGSDLSSSVTSLKVFKNVPFSVGHKDHTLVLKANTVVVSSAITPDNPELVAARQARKTILHRSDLISLVSKSFKTITVSGTHGKSTTSALISYILLKMNLEPSFILGAKILGPDDTSTASRLGTGEYLVLESDESDGTFQKYHPFVAVVTNIDQDHMDFYGSMDAMEDAFFTHLNNIDPDGFSVLFWDHDRVRAIAARNLPGTRLTYGSFLGSEVRLLGLNQLGTNLLFEAVVEHEKIQVRLPLIGRHNAFNALAAIAAVTALGLSASRSAKALETFPGVSRRMSLLFEDSKAVVYDDYAHNPVKISSCLAGARAAFPNSRIVAIFQGHRYSRLRHMYVDMLSAFKDVNEVFVVPVFSAGEPFDSRYDPVSLARDVVKFSQTAARGTQSLKEALELLQLDQPSKHTVYVTVGAGDVGLVAKQFAEYLKTLSV